MAGVLEVVMREQQRGCKFARASPQKSWSSSRRPGLELVGHPASYLVYAVLLADLEKLVEWQAV